MPPHTDPVLSRDGRILTSEFKCSSHQSPLETLNFCAWQSTAFAPFVANVATKGRRDDEIRSSGKEYKRGTQRLTQGVKLSTDNDMMDRAGEQS